MVAMYRRSDRVHKPVMVTGWTVNGQTQSSVPDNCIVLLLWFVCCHGDTCGEYVMRVVLM